MVNSASKSGTDPLHGNVLNFFYRNTLSMRATGRLSGICSSRFGGQAAANQKDSLFLRERRRTAPVTWPDRGCSGS